jgi:hypothetical protein
MLESTESVLAAQLDSDEKLLWAGQPRGGLRLRPQDIFLIPFSLVWGGFAIFWEVSALSFIPKGAGPIGVIFPLFGLPFVLAGLYLIFGRFFVDARVRARTYYGVTSERIIILSGLFSRQVKSLPLRSLSDISLTQRNDGSGSITFGPTHFIHGFFPGGSWPGTGKFSPPSFDLIEHAKDVYDLIRKAQRTPSTL